MMRSLFAFVVLATSCKWVAAAQSESAASHANSAAPDYDVSTVKSGKGPVNVLVVDNIEPPIEN
ncbi:MAG TPA: hypothetical protein VGU25_00660 [Acidobacteriaceae bacterium]|nr:hypothetical protein [Acidobacteriaceae bacterium]